MFAGRPVTEQFDRPTDQEREELFRMDLDGLNIKDQTIHELVRLTGPRDGRPGLTFSDLRSKLLPDALCRAFPNRALTEDDLIARRERSAALSRGRKRMMPPSASYAAGGPAALPLLGRRVQIAGSASGKTDPALIGYAHEVVRNLVKGVMAAGGGIVVGIGREPRPDGAAPDAPSLLFDWTALETAAECLKQGFPAWPAEFRPAHRCRLFREGGIRDSG